ncbi:retron St85 family RNA-directed DNA polymerase [Methylocystis iwaonis]|nr:retron St85 family RNA-directed DNA polymerase [Methylocystis iwaonis]
MSELDVRVIVTTAPVRYKRYSIEKRNGGERIISQPAKEVKYLQRIFVEEFLTKLPVHSAAKAYREGLSIRSNAEVHAESGAILKFDFSNFFPSIRSDDWSLYCKKNSVFDEDEDIYLSSMLLFSRTSYGSLLRLAIGAPSSPALSNILMFDFDSLITEEMKKDKVNYTRYADDLTFSAKRVGNLSGVERALRRTIKEVSFPRLRLNEDKTVLATKKYRRVVTGLVLSDAGTVSLGRDRKREIRAAVHHYTMGRLDSKEISRLGGMLAFVKAVEPDFLLRLSEKFGQGTIKRIKTGQPPQRPLHAQADSSF